MNNVVLMGRLAREVEVSVSGNGTTIVKNSIAVDRKVKKDDNDPNQQTVDFINITAFGKTAEFIEKYFHKGNRICLNGHIQTGSYVNQQGQTVYTTYVIVENVEFCESKSNNQLQTASATPQMAQPQLAPPVAPAPQMAAPVAPAPQMAAPVAPAPQMAAPVAPAPQMAAPVAPQPQMATPVAPAPAVPQMAMPQFS